MFILDWVNAHEPLWLFVFLLSGLLIELHSNYMLRKEYDYDKEKDDRKYRKTRNTKKTTKSADGASVTEETIEEVTGGHEDPKRTEENKNV